MCILHNVYYRILLRLADTVCLQKCEEVNDRGRECAYTHCVMLIHTPTFDARLMIRGVRKGVLMYM